MVQSLVENETCAAPEAARSSLWARLERRRSSILKSAFGLTLLLTGSWAFHRAVIRTVSTDASVTSTFFDVTAPIDGFVEHGIARSGQIVSASKPIATLSNPLLDRATESELVARLAALDADIQALDRSAIALRDLSARFDARGTSYRRHRTTQLRILLEEARSRIESDSARRDQSKAKLARVDELQRTGLAAAPEREQAEQELTAAERALSSSTHELQNVSATLDALRQGMTIGEFSATDRPYSNQRVDDVRLRLTDVEAESALKRGQRDALAAQLRTRRTELDLLSQNVLRIPERANVWDVSAQNGEFVLQGRRLFRLTLCSKLHVLAYVSERSYDRLSVGDAAEIRLAGRRAVYKGNVSLLLGAAELRVGPASALHMADQLRERYAVVVVSDDLARDESQRCEVGHTAQVEFHPGKS